jgi:hypothetical protein
MPNREILGKVVCILIAQFGGQNPVLKGVAYMQVTNHLSCQTRI